MVICPLVEYLIECLVECDVNLFWYIIKYETKRTYKHCLNGEAGGMTRLLRFIDILRFCGVDAQVVC